jgi:signal transduction histidine kinase
MTPEKVDKIVAPIAEGEAYGQRGTGLGLYIARRAAALLGAKLSADSKVGEGSTFYLDLTQA